jgi:hypothetical protein
MATSISILREYLANRVFCQLLKVYQVKKRVHLQQFGIIHLPSLDLTYINNMREKQNYVYALPPLENLDHESFSILYFFTPSYRTWHVGETPMLTRIGARIFPCGDVSFAKFLFFLPS